MDKDRIDYLHTRYISGRLTESELREWKTMVDSPFYESRVLSFIEQSWKQLPDEILSDIEQEISDEMLLRITSKPQIKPKRRNLWITIPAAAAILVLIFTSVWYFSKESPAAIEPAYSNDIPPGKIGATLTLGNGKKIKLTNTHNGRLANEGGVEISKSKDGQLVYKLQSGNSKENSLNTLSTGPGEAYQVLLPDGSSVWLNAESSLTYYTRLEENGKRLVKLSGEGYFEITKDKSHPFIVETLNQKVEVLGTHFNINSYKDEPNEKTTLLEGSVKVTGINDQLGTLLPGQEAVLTAKMLAIERADVELATAWKNDKFMFESASIGLVMRMIKRWYDVEVIYDGEPPSNKFGGSISRYENVSKVLEILEDTRKVHFKIEGRRIIVTK